MGYGGVLKKVARVAIPVAVSIAVPGNPWAVAIASSLTTAATGGSFKESLMAGATSYAGSTVSDSFNTSAQAGLNASAAEAATQAGQTVVTGAINRGVDIGLAEGLRAGAEQTAFAASGGIGTFADAITAGSGLTDDFANFTNQTIGGNSVFTPSTPTTSLGGDILAGGKKVFKTVFEHLQNMGNAVLPTGVGPINLTSAIAGQAPST